VWGRWFPKQNTYLFRIANTRVVVRVVALHGMSNSAATMHTYSESGRVGVGQAREHGQKEEPTQTRIHTHTHTQYLSEKNRRKTVITGVHLVIVFFSQQQLTCQRHQVVSPKHRMDGSFIHSCLPRSSNTACRARTRRGRGGEERTDHQPHRHRGTEPHHESHSTCNTMSEYLLLLPALAVVLSTHSTCSLMRRLLKGRRRCGGGFQCLFIYSWLQHSTRAYPPALTPTDCW
jgi:hypothetical protein